MDDAIASNSLTVYVESQLEERSLNNAFSDTLLYSDNFYTDTVNIFRTIENVLQNRTQEDFISAILETLNYDVKSEVTLRSVSLATLLEIVYSGQKLSAANSTLMSSIATNVINKLPVSALHTKIAEILLQVSHKSLLRKSSLIDSNLLNCLFTLSTIAQSQAQEILLDLFMKLSASQTDAIYGVLFEWMNQKNTLNHVQQNFFVGFFYFMCVQKPYTDMCKNVTDFVLPQLRNFQQASISYFYYLKALSLLEIDSNDSWKACSSLLLKVSRILCSSHIRHCSVLLSAVSTMLAKLIGFINIRVSEKNYFKSETSLYFNYLKSCNLFKEKMFQPKIPEEIINRNNLMNLIYTLFSEKTIFTTLIEKSDPTICIEYVEAFSIIMRQSSACCFILPPMLTFLNQTIQLSTKQKWMTAFQLWAVALNNLQDVASNFVTTVEQNMDFAKLLLHLYIKDVQKYTSSETNSLKEQYSVLDQIWESKNLGAAYSLLTDYWFESLLKHSLTHIANILKQNELIFATQTAETEEELKLKQLKQSEIKLYKKQLRQCTEAIFQTFTLKTLFKIPALTLDNLISTPLDSSLYAQYSNSWLLPMLPHLIKRDNLSFFLEYFLKIAKELHTKSTKIAIDNIQMIQSKQYKTLEEQIWSTIPSFFRQSLDAPEIFSSSAKAQPLSTTLMNYLDVPNIRNYICSSVITFINELQHMDSFTQKLWNQEDPFRSNSVIEEFANQFMGMLVVRYLQFQKNLTHNVSSIVQSESSRVSQLFFNTLKSLIEICNVDLIQKNIQNFSTALKTTIDTACLIVSGKKDSTTLLQSSDCESLIDVVDVLLLCIPPSDITGCVNFFLPILLQCCQHAQESVKRKVSKSLNILPPLEAAQRIINKSVARLYKILKHLLHRATACPEVSFTIDEVTQIWKTIYQIRVISRSIALKSRTSFLRVFVQFISKQNIDDNQILSDILSSLIPEVLLNLISPNKSIKIESQDLLKSIAEHLCTENNLFTYLLPGLAAKATSMRCVTLSALALLVSNYGDRLKADALKNVFQVALACLRQPEKELFAGGFLYIKRYQNFLNREDQIEAATKYIPALLESEHRETYRIPLRHFFEKIVRKLGMQNLSSVFPENHTQLLQYINKQIRKKKLRTVRKTDADNAESENEELKTVYAVKSKADDFTFDFSSDEENTKPTRQKRTLDQPKTFLVDSEQFDLLEPEEKNFVLGQPNKKARTHLYNKNQKPDASKSRELSSVNPFVPNKAKPLNVKTLPNLSSLKSKQPKPTLRRKKPSKTRKPNKLSTSSQAKKPKEKIKKPQKLQPSAYIKFKPSMMKELNKKMTIRTLKETVKKL